ncbi:MAG TPA: L,D-transpeptidase family protein [Rhizomicrobium sp.]
MLRSFVIRLFVAGVLWAGPTMAVTPALAGAAESLEVQTFYQMRHDAPAWTGNAAAQANAKLALAALAAAAGEGLDPERYRVPAEPAGYDAALTGAVLAYMHDVAEGRPDLRSVDTDIALPPRMMDMPALLDRALSSGTFSQLLAGLAPSHAGYLALKTKLAETTDPHQRDIIAVNMERWRWLPKQLEADRIEVNAATAELTMWLGGRQVLASRVIVGKPATRTPILRAEGAGITVNPVWNVPHSIAVKEILPKLKRNPAWLASQDMVLLDGPPGDPHGLHVNWRAIPAGTFPYRVRQAAGPRNPLGQVKLELPNRFDVYLHDTPGKAAFNRTGRAVSHGCIRVEQILPLASYALSADQSSLELIRDAIGQGETRLLPLSRKLPIYVLYWTAVPEPEGGVRFVRDLYGRDQRMIAVMRQQSLRVAAVEPGCRRA